MTHRSALATVLALVAAATFGANADGLGAQEVRGRLLGEGRRPLAGAYVRLEGAGGAAVATTITNAAGWFSLEARAAGVHTVRAEFIGHGAVEREVVLSAGEPVTIELVATPRPIEIEGLTVEGDRKCDVPPEVAEGVATLWDEVGKALQVTALVEAEGLFRFEVDRWRRTLDPRTLRIREERRRPATGLHAGSPFASLPPDELAARGYVQGERGDAEMSYYAPDAGVLVSRSFQDTHCFGLTTRAPEPGWAGLTFQPRDPAAPDIAGTLWFDLGTYAPQRIDFDYWRLPWDIDDAEEIGGRVEFARVPEGPWIVRRWWIRMPVVEERRFRVRAGDVPEVRYGLAAVVEEGGEVRQVRSDDRRLMAFALGGVEGTVRDSISGQPVPGALVTVGGTEIRTRADEDGAFRFDQVPAGRYRVVVTTEALRSVGARAREHPVVVADEATTRVEVRLPSPAVVLAAACQTPLSDEGTGVLAGRVVGLPEPPGADVAVEVSWESMRWLNPGVDRTFSRSERRARVPLSEDGTFVACGLQDDETYRVIARGEGLAGKPADVRVAEGGVARVTLTLGEAGTADALVARVVDGSGAGLEGARVTLVGSARSAVTDARGLAVFDDPRTGEAVVRVELLGYAPREDTLVVADTAVTVVTVTMSERAFELEPILVEVATSVAAANRARGSRGSFALSRIDIGDAVARGATDLARLVKEAAPAQIHLSTVSTTTQYVGSCIVYARSIQGRRSEGDPDWCAQVVLDGAWMDSVEAARLLDTFPLSQVESLEFLSPQEATFRFGTAAGSSNARNGVIVIETRRNDH